MAQEQSREEILEYVRTSNAIEGIYAGEGDRLHFGQHMSAVSTVLNSTQLLSLQEIHAQIMSNLLEDGEVAGQFRKSEAYIGSKPMPKANIVPKLMLRYEVAFNVFFASVKSENYPEHGLTQALAILHDIGLCIHPFSDGNGRTFRLALNHWRRLSGLTWIQFTPEVWKEHLVRLKEYEREVFRPVHAWAYEPDT